MNSKQQREQHEKMKRFPVDMESFPKSYHFQAEGDSFAESSEDTFRWLGIQLSLFESTLNMYWVS